jgi:hypothetical protein
LIAADPESLAWASPFRAAFHDYDGMYARFHALNPEAAARWRVAQLAAEGWLSDGEGEEFEKWQERADRIEQYILAGTWEQRH